MDDSRSNRGFQLSGKPQDPDGATPAEPNSFSTFVLSLTTSALYHLGVPLGESLGMPELSEAKIDLEMGRQTIEMLEMLRRKTRGNLEPDEAKLLDEAIRDLQLRFVEVKRQTAT